MPLERKLGSVVVWLLMAAMCGLVGFFIVYHYAAYERPSEHFAIVIDAGSTQTRSSLYRLTVHVPELADWSERVSNEFAKYEDTDEPLDETKFNFPLSELLQVRQVSSCVNGGPLASISSPLEARDLIRACLIKFTNHIKLLNFASDAGGATIGDDALDGEEVSRQLALTDHRVNSVTHMYLGATAGMRALERLNRTRAGEKLRWIDEAIGRSNELMLDESSPFVNKGFVGIIEGSDEASFGWISANFVCDTLAVHAPLTVLSMHNDSVENSGSQVYRLDQTNHRLQPMNFVRRAPHSIGILELGGASAQMAFQVAANQLGSQQIHNMSLDEQNLSLFNGHYRMATRSDLCLGMSQAVLRANYVLLHRTFANSVTNQPLPNAIQLSSPCLQKGARIKVSGQELAKVWQGACLESNKQLDPLRRELDSAFRKGMTSRQSLELVGTGDTDLCDGLLDDLIDPTRCRRHFSLCPSGRNAREPPQDMPFITMSGFNHALNVLGLGPAGPRANQVPVDPEWQKLATTIDHKLGGNSIDYSEFLDKTRRFCSTNSSDLLVKYPKVNRKFQDIICLQLVYIRKLLTEFYRFEPSTSWSQIKFLVFAPKSVPSQFAALKKSSESSPNVKQVKLDARRDIGWTLGLLLNATSYQLGTSDPNEIYFHHGASIWFIIRVTILLMLACCLVAIGLLVAGVAEVRQAQSQNDGYISHDSTSSASSYDVSYLATTPRHSRSSSLKPTGLKYVLSE